MVEVPLLVFGLRECIFVVGGDWRLILEYVGNISSFLSTLIVSHETWWNSFLGLCQIFAILGGPDLSLCQMMSMGKKCADNVNKEFLVEPNSGQVVGKMKIEKFMTRMDTLGSWIWLVQTEISGSQKYINLKNLRVAEKNSLRESKIIQQKLTTDRDDPRCTLISKTKSLIVSNWSHLSNRGRFDWWIDLANPGLQPLSSRLL